MTQKYEVFPMTKPSKSHLVKFLRGIRAYWLADIDERVCQTSKSTVDTVMSANSFKSYYPREIAMSFGLKSGYLRLEPTKGKEGKEFDVYATPKGWELIIHLKKTTCAFSGRIVRHGEF